MNSNTRDQIRQWIAQKQVSVVESPAPVEVQTQPTQPTQPTELVIQPTELVEPRSVIRDEIILGNCIKELKRIPSNTFTAVITDPPYFLSFMGKKWDSAPEEVENKTAAQMIYFQKWSEEWAKEVLRVLKPGGHLLSFGGTRTYHRMVCGIEDAGFQIRDKMDEYCEMDGYLAWVHGQGFPKSYAIFKSGIKPEIEKQLREQGVVGGIEWKDESC